MPSLHKRKDSPYWIAAYTDAKGRRLKRSTKSTSYEEAGKIAREWEEAIQLAKKKRAVAKQYQAVLRDIHEQVKTPGSAALKDQISPEYVSNQRELAITLGVSQATVSKALRGDRSISQDMRRKVQETAAQLDYQPNAYVNVLMSRVRSGKKLNDKGVIAMLVDKPSLEIWHLIPSFRTFYGGAIRRGRELGFRVEPFFLRAPNMDAAKIERILQARGIQGVILAPPYRGNRSLQMAWEHHAVVGVGFGWEEQEFDRVAYDNLANYITAFEGLLRLGYQRIGTVLDDILTMGTYKGIKWYTGFLECQSRLRHEQRIPVCQLPTMLRGDGAHDEQMFTASFQEIRRQTFQEWLEKWKPDALLTIGGYECEWLEAMEKRWPEDIGIACLAEPIKLGLAKINEKADEVGATALEWVSSKIARNEYGFSRCPKVTMIEGEWVTGYSVRDQNWKVS